MGHARGAAYESTVKELEERVHGESLTRGHAVKMLRAQRGNYWMVPPLNAAPLICPATPDDPGGVAPLSLPPAVRDDTLTGSKSLR